ncbi:exoribonuclease II [Cellvibrio japonicus]|uniref:exoribonuclease II n=1 Tax=Cellvibrio japonicus (strain Ueda107) TaxID=498211 RepID=B3PIE9_CELJU|nr:VacB/RNase II family 3'-5' exoribonuclease [Cellvibrio japonicus]ACE83191.1 exoribonuclease II [Cellvibrio japonicus Ueda107]QEI12549.1 VacB/RNase II family 3'-5' exoribonuclease [Cellvibrio japonicus]QEI16123.1 VacB/RNase II family 3'-5' exoribonuclease [Cellvibrio japonicus]QEI19701.1 VacB/RNase II family 3'-5' exoribonuclease [Cellvibrio japonicus]
MLNNDALQQLASLKSSLVAQKDIAQGTIRTTTKRFGFILLDDGREAFLDPEQILRVLPEDRAEAEITTNAKGQYEAKLTKLLHSNLQEFVGRYVSKGTNFFVEPDLVHFNRWLFVPPQDRKGLTEGDLVHCQVARHPFHCDGKAQVHILKRLGNVDEPGIESRYAIARFQLPCEWPPAAQNQASSIHWSPLVFENNEEDLTQLPFVTIDSESTRDMDDAVCIQATEHGWELFSAIADPTKHIDFDSPLEQAARERASTHYILGNTLTMLPVDLSQDTYSLVAEQKRPALVCRIHIRNDGHIESFAFSEAVIRSRQKLSYQGVYDFLTTAAETNLSDELRTQLTMLRDFALARSQYRQQHNLLMEEKPDYQFILNEQKKIERVEKRDRTIAHRIVEEAMLATNLCAGELFSQHPGYGIFSGHIGFRPERVNDAVALIQEDRPDLSPGDLSQLKDFLNLFRELRQNPGQHPANAALHSLLQRQLQAGALSQEPVPHFGLGFNAYAMVTSPIRRYNDFFNHLGIKRLLRGEPPLALDNLVEFVERLQHKLNLGRQACRFTETWLACQYMNQHIGSVHTGNIALVNSTGIGVRLDDWGMEGFIPLVPRDSDIKAQFDSRRLSLNVNGNTYKLDEVVQVVIDEVDVSKRRVALSLVDEATAARLRAWLE